MNIIPKIKLIKLNIWETLFTILIILMVLYSFIGKLIPYFSYIDDIFTVAFIFIAILKYFLASKKEVLNKYDKWILILSIVVVIVGIVGNIISQYQTNILAILVDIVCFFKFFGIFLAGLIIFEDQKGDRNYEVAEYCSKIILIITGAIAILNYIFKLGLGEKHARFGLPIYSLGGHPSFAAAVCCACTSILLYERKKNIKWIIAGFILTALTLRMKAIAYVVLMIIYLIFNKGKKDIGVKEISIYGLIACAISWKYIAGYFLDLTASRGVAMQAGIELAMRFLPIGAGFATFGTVGSTISYSKAYDILGISKRYGFSRTASSFVGDGGWATEIGQFGIIGVILFVLMLFLIYKTIKEKLSEDTNNAPYVSIILYLLICSTSENALCSNYAVLLAIALCILIKKGRRKKQSEIGEKEK